mmetsp:Transcript_15867/g.29059  ORF Transcript_15867/g.29059 Transcript_15867/m.29059 type:complete len:449 (-) Transcript_15867:27-1373(-)
MALLFLYAGLLASSLAITPIAYNQTQLEFNQTIDHFHLPLQDAGIFTQRYWVVDDYFNPSQQRVFLLLCGEAECPGVNTARLFPIIAAKNFNALIFVLEHRYYGESQPYGPSAMLPQLLSYLEVQQALADIANFIRSMNSQWNFTSPNWIINGGSYSGGLSAWFRTRYPDLVKGAWASSAVVKPLLNFTDFDKQVYVSAMLSGQACVDGIRSVNSLVESYYLAGNLTNVTDLFNATALFNSTPDGRPVLWFIADIMAESIQYGSRTLLCQAVTSSSDAWTRLVAVANLTTNLGLADPTGYAVSSLASLIWTPSGNGRQWMWQMCAQLGWFQPPSQYMMRSQYLDLSFWNWYCNEIFGYPGGLQNPDTSLAGAQLNYLGTNIIFLNGIEDPWQWVGVTTWDSNDRPSILINCQNCGHCVDLYTPTDQDSSQLNYARSMIITYIQKWLSS